MEKRIYNKKELMHMFKLNENKFNEIIDVLENNKDIHSIKPPHEVHHWLFWYQYPIFKEHFLAAKNE